jgi:hypothetical protein
MRYASKEQLLSSIQGEHDRLLDLLDQFPRQQCRAPGVWGDEWTLKDLVAHLNEWHAIFLRWYRDGLAGREPDIPALGYKWNETPRLNRDIWEMHKDRSWRDVRAEFGRSYGEILELVQGLSEEELLRPGHFAWTGSNPLTTYLGANTCSHYRFAIKVIKRWQRQLGRH